VSWNQLEEEIGAGTEISIVDDEEISRTFGECVSHVSCLFKLRSVLAAHVGESITFAEIFDFWLGSIVQNEDLHFSGDVFEFGDVLPGVIEDFERLFADGQEDIDSWGGFFVERVLFDNLVVFLEIELLSHDGDTERCEDVEF
jgi:hypothetical protein